MLQPAFLPHVCNRLNKPSNMLGSLVQVLLQFDCKPVTRLQVIDRNTDGNVQRVRPVTASAASRVFVHTIPYYIILYYTIL